MRKGILLKLLSFALVIGLLSAPVFAKSRISVLDEMIVSGSEVVGMGSVSIPLKYQGEAFDDAMYHVLPNTPIHLNRGVYIIPARQTEVRRALNKMSRMNFKDTTETASYFDEKINKYVKVVFTYQSEISTVICEVFVF